MELKPGYKQTEVGVIPEDWEVKTLQQVCQTQITYGIVQCGPHIRDGVPYVRVSDFDSPMLKVDAMLRTSPLIASRFMRSTVEVGDLVYALRGKLGEVRTVTESVAGANLTQGTARLSPAKVIDPDYFVWAMRVKRVVNQANLEAKGTTFREITLADLRRLLLSLPPLPEQKAIAKALSDMDRLLSGLDSLIAKKRDIKQATMQQLLTGKTRLPGFSGEWEVKRLGEVLRIRHGKSQHEVVTSDGVYPILASGGEIGRSNAYLYNKPSVLIGRKGTIDSPQYVDTPFWTVDTLFYSEIEPEAYPKFLFYKFTMIPWRRYNEASGVPSLNARTIESIDISVPPLPEQQAIAKVLTDMDAELEALEQRREKTRELKQAMMQELLTGRTRLV